MPRDNSPTPAASPDNTATQQPAATKPPLGLAGAAAFTVVWLAITAGFLFWNLGWYPFWGDEADTVIFARSVWETGDTGAKYGDHNYYLYRSGSLLDHMKNRSTPPLAYYVAAPLWGAFGPDHFWMRVPFALFGLATVGLVCWWLWRGRASAAMWLCVGASIALNPQFLLYSRQCRYYAMASLITLGVAYFYWYYCGRRGQVVAIAALLCLLAATHYLHFAALAAVLVVDYVLWQRRERPLTLRDWLWLCVPIVVVVVPLAIVYNPIGKNSLGEDLTKNFFSDKVKLLFLSLRDMNSCEFGVGMIIACAPIVARWRKDTTLMRLFVACGVYVFTTTICSPQPMTITKVADVRYLAPLLIPCLYLTIRTIDTALQGRGWLVVPITALAMGTNVLNRPDDPSLWRSTTVEFVHELRHPRTVATRVVADWLKANVKEGETVWLEPNEYAGSQIIEAPHVQYAWELGFPPHLEQFMHLPRIHIQFEVPVEYLVVFGLNDTLERVKTKVIPGMAERQCVYEPIETIDIHFDDHTRPELHWHWFRDEPYDKTKHSIQIYRLKR